MGYGSSTKSGNDRDRFARDIENGPAASGYFFRGRDEFLIESALAELKRRLVAPGFEAFDFDLCYGGEHAFADILKKLESPPFASPRRMVVLKTLKKMPPVDRDALFSYLDAPNPSSCLVCVMLLDPAKDWRKPDALTATLETKAKTYTFTLDELDVTRAITDRARQKGLTLEPDAALLLREMVGDSLYMVDSELDKLKVYLDRDSTVTSEVIARLSGNSRAYLVWDLNRTAAERDRPTALRILRRLEEWKEEPTMIIGALANRFFGLLKDKTMPREPPTPFAPAMISGKKSMVASEPSARGRRWSRAEVVGGLRRLKEIDLVIKQGRQDPFYLLESFIIQHF